MKSDAKAALRRRMRQVRGAIAADDRAVRSERVTRSVLALPELQRPGAVMVFSSFGSEVSTSGLIAQLHEAGVTTLLPYVEQGTLGVARHGPEDELVASSYGVLEPASRSPFDVDSIGVIIAPGLAFDRAGRRLGYGGGFYDRFLRRLQAGGGSVVVIGVGFDEQLIEEVPVGDGDVRIDLVVTDRQIVRCGPADADLSAS